MLRLRGLEHEWVSSGSAASIRSVRGVGHGTRVLRLHSRLIESCAGRLLPLYVPSLPTVTRTRRTPVSLLRSRSSPRSLALTGALAAPSFVPGFRHVDHGFTRVSLSLSLSLSD